MTRWWIWGGFVVAWTIALEAPVPDPGRLPGGQIILTNKLLVAKTAHVAVYALFAILSGWVAVPSKYRWMMMLFLMAHASVTELLQLALEEFCHRGGSLSDVAFNHLGILAGALMSWKWWTRDGA